MLAALMMRVADGSKELSLIRPARARTRLQFTVVFYGFENLLPQNGAILRNAAQIRLVRTRSEKQTAQHREKLRKNSLGN